MSSIDTYDFSLDVPQNWKKELEKIKNEAGPHLRSNVYWGVHEQFMGIRDFSRSPALRLEKYLNLIQSLGMTVEFLVPLNSSIHSFPSWAFDDSSMSLVGSFTQGKTEFKLYELPSIYDQKIFSYFLDFLRELCEISSLYLYPDGPLTSINIDLRVFAVDLNTLFLREFPLYLSEHYESIKELNALYGTYFRHFNDVATNSGFKLLMNRRPWHATFDYRLCREKIYKKMNEELYKIIIQENLFRSLKLLLQNNFSHEDSNYFFEGNFIDVFDTLYFPCFPCGFFNEIGITTYRCWDVLASKKEKFSLINISDIKLPNSNLIIISCGPYFCRKNMNVVINYLKEGGVVFFPNGLPIYDEKMQLFSWPFTKKKSIFILNQFKIDSFQLGDGVLWSSNIKFNEDMSNILDFGCLKGSLI